MTHVRLGVLEYFEGEGEVLLGQADQVLPQEAVSGAGGSALAAVQEGDHPLVHILHIPLLGGLGGMDTE